MKKASLLDMEEYCGAKSSPETDLRRELARVTREKSRHAGMLVGHIEGDFLRMLVRLLQAKRVLEIGTFTGYSALAIAEGMAHDGELITLDINHETAAIAQEFWAKSPLGNKIRLITGPALESLKTIDGPFDMVFIDADKKEYPQYWDICVPKVRTDGFIVLDNVFQRGRVIDPADERARMMDSFNGTVRNDPRVETLMLPIRDGVTLARKI